MNQIEIILNNELTLTSELNHGTIIELCIINWVKKASGLVFLMAARKPINK